MEQAPGRQQFETAVYPDEIEVIRGRRAAQQLPADGLPEPLTKEAAARGDCLVPDPAHGTVGLALSGGGIRSATFNLGVLQVFVKRGLIKWFDYLSTVSGGGYIGATLSTAFHFAKGDLSSSFEHERGKEESETIKHLRNGGNYLAPGGLLDLLRIPAILFRGLAINLLVVAPVVALFAIATVWRYPDLLSASTRTASDYFTGTIWMAGAFAVWILLFPVVATVSRHPPYAWRSRYEQTFSLVLLAAVAVPVLESLPLAYRTIPQDLEIQDFLQGLVAGAAALLPVVNSMASSERRSPIMLVLKLAVISVVGPLILVLLYWIMLDVIYSGGRGAGNVVPLANVIWFGLAAAAVYAFTRVFVNVNRIGLHRFYRDRLSKAYLVHPKTQEHVDKLRISDLDSAKTGAPYHLINTTLNIPGTKNRDLQGRGAEFFFLSPRWSGSRQTGYCSTRALEAMDADVNLGTGIAVSGAAVSPFTGSARGRRGFAFLLTILNIRLDLWIPNPARVGFSRIMDMMHRRLYRVGTAYLIMELFGWLNARSKYVNLSDGGHIDNLGLYELLRRRCRYIVCVDAERDPNMIFKGLGKVTAYARMDHGINIEWANLSQLAKDDQGHSRTQWAFGSIDYGPGKEAGNIVYIKSSLNGNEPRDIATYRATHPQFPHESTGDQFFDESQFESYRALGYHIANQVFDCTDLVDIAQWFDDREREAKATLPEPVPPENETESGAAS